MRAKKTPPPLDLAFLTQTRAITLEDAWSGLSPASPVAMSAHLERRPDGSFAGRATLRAASQRQSLDGVVPAAVASEILRLLSSAEARPGNYQPLITHTDDIPEISLTLEIPGGTVRVDTQSQGETHVPWRLTHDDREYVIDSPEPAQALALLRRHLGERALDAMVRAVRS